MKTKCIFDFFTSFNNVDDMIKMMGNPSHESEESFYWKDNEYFYRCSDHWGNVKCNDWNLSEDAGLMIDMSDYVVCRVLKKDMIEIS